MIKLIIKQSKKNLNEELKYSKNVFNLAFKFLNNSKEDSVLKIPISYEEISFNSKAVENGLVLTHLINNLGQNIEYIKKFEKYWDFDKKTFTQSIIKQVKSLNFNNVYFKAAYNEKPNNLGGKLTTKSVKGSEASIVKITTYMNNTNTDEDLAGTIVHELQHVTQYLNQISLNYYKQLLKVSSFSQINPIKIENLVINVGIGRDPKGIKYSKELSLSDYYISDDEYETYLTSIVRTCYSYVLKKEKFEIKQISDFTSKFVTKIVNDKNFAKEVLLTHGVKNLFDIFQNILKARPKELVRDIKIDLEKMLLSK